MSAPAAASSAAAISGSKRPFPVAENDRHARRRHFHLGPDPVAASPSGAAAAAEAAGPRPSPAARLYRHALESIFGWLNQRELATALQVSKDWLDAVKSMGSLRLTIRKPPVPLRVVADSAMGRHVVRFDVRVPLIADALFIVARHMPQLRELSCELQLVPSEGPLTFPPGLQTLHVHFHGTPAAADVNTALKALRRMSLLESLTVHLSWIGDQLSFAPLASLPQLRDLGIIASDEDAVLSDAQVTELRGIANLRRLGVQPMPTSLLRRLLAQPHALQWQQIRLPAPLRSEAAALLSQLPSLTEIDVLVLGSQFGWLHWLTNLTRVNMRVGQFHDAVGAWSLAAGLQRCTKIESLRLECPGLDTAHLASLLPRLPQLCTLTLDRLSIASLSCFAHAPMTQQLSHLVLSRCKGLPVIELRHVHALRGLETLEIRGSFAAPLDDHSRWLLTPPSITLPQLQTFVHTTQ